MKTMTEMANESQVVVEDANAQYDKVISMLQEAKENNVAFDEGLFGAVVGGLTGATIGPKVMKAICKALGVDEKGPFGSLLTSRLILTAVGATVGWK